MIDKNIERFFITGDKHGNFSSLYQFMKQFSANENIGLIILGDAGFNFYLSGTDNKLKNKIKNKYSNLYFYCVRGNHEERPENLNYAREWDNNVLNEIYLDPINPNIRYLIDGKIYDIFGHKTLVIGGAYSIDRDYRLLRAGLTAQDDPNLIKKRAGWFPDEQLTMREQYEILNTLKTFATAGVDYVFSHTCPIMYEPVDLFLSFVDQSKVDKTMENFLQEIAESLNWKEWYFGHYHADRDEAENVHQLYNNYIEVEVKK